MSRTANPSAEAASSTASLEASSGRLHSPPQMPCSGRRVSSTRPCSSCASNQQASRTGMVFFGRGVGSSRQRPSRYATQSRDNGQTPQPGLLRVQTRLPRSICPWVYAAMSPEPGGNNRVASCHSRASTFLSPGQPSMPAQRVSTRLTLPSRIATRAPAAKAAIAAAVERPMPGRRSSSAGSTGNTPPSVSSTSRAARCRLRARV